MYHAHPARDEETPAAAPYKSPADKDRTGNPPGGIECDPPSSNSPILSHTHFYARAPGQNEGQTCCRFYTESTPRETYLTQGAIQLCTHTFAPQGHLHEVC